MNLLRRLGRGKKKHTLLDEDEGFDHSSKVVPNSRGFFELADAHAEDTTWSQRGFIPSKSLDLEPETKTSIETKKCKKKHTKKHKKCKKKHRDKDKYESKTDGGFEPEPVLLVYPESRNIAHTSGSFSKIPLSDSPYPHIQVLLETASQGYPGPGN